MRLRNASHLSDGYRVQNTSANLMFFRDIINQDYEKTSELLARELSDPEFTQPRQAANK